jgi:hypothetical protein
VQNCVKNANQSIEGFCICFVGADISAGRIVSMDRTYFEVGRTNIDDINLW